MSEGKTIIKKKRTKNKNMSLGADIYWWFDKKHHLSHLSFVFLIHKMSVKTTAPAVARLARESARIRMLSEPEYSLLKTPTK